VVILGSLYSNLDDSIWRGLACAALQPKLRTILLFNANPKSLRIYSRGLAKMLKITDSDAKVIQLSVSDSEDDLWGKYSVTSISGSDANFITWQPGFLGSENKENELRLLVIPDLTKLSLAASRACISAMDSSVIHLERHGKTQVWKPNLCWLAGCSKNRIGAVSPHLLERFALRLTVKTPPIVDLVEVLQQLVDSKDSANLEDQDLIPSGVEEALKQAMQHRPKLTPDGLIRVIDNISVLETYSARRAASLARLALAEAQLANIEQVTGLLVDRIAETIGLELNSEEANSLEWSAPSAIQKSNEVNDLNSEEITNPNEYIPSVEESEEDVNTKPVYSSNTTEKLDPSYVSSKDFLKGPYPEDSAPVDREVMSLKFPPKRFRTIASAKGVTIGTEPAKTIQDLALVSTLFEAAKYQLFRQQKRSKSRGKLILSTTDFRAYRRAPIAEQMFCLVIDHTCLRKCLWQDMLLPYLSWAYQERASVCLVQVGAAVNQNSKKIIDSSELQATKAVERSILVPRISAGIEAPAGRSTPLAHGLELSLQTLRHALQHGRNTVQKALLVVITDGRGNVPLAASRSGLIEPFIPVKRQGIEDALMIAEQIRNLDHLDIVLLSPKPVGNTEPSLELGKSLGVKTENFILMQSLDNEEVIYG
jgi:magnesium chelatase subunit D